MTIQIYLGRNIGLDEHVSDEEMGLFILSSVSRRFDAFTVHEAKGYWRGVPERTTIIEVSGEDLSRAPVEEIAREYARLFRQEAVLIRTLPSRDELIFGEEKTA